MGLFPVLGALGEESTFLAAVKAVMSPLPGCHVQSLQGFRHLNTLHSHNTLNIWKIPARTCRAVQVSTATGSAFRAGL